jgi:hypothetical protein
MSTQISCFQHQHTAAGTCKNAVGDCTQLQGRSSELHACMYISITSCEWRREQLYGGRLAGSCGASTEMASARTS